MRNEDAPGGGQLRGECRAQHPAPQSMRVRVHIYVVTDISAPGLGPICLPILPQTAPYISTKPAATYNGAASSEEVLTRRITQLEVQLDDALALSARQRLELEAAEATAAASASSAAAAARERASRAEAERQATEARCRTLEAEREEAAAASQRQAERLAALERAATSAREDAAAVRDLARHSGDLQSQLARAQRQLAEERGRAARAAASHDRRLAEAQEAARQSLVQAREEAGLEAAELRAAADAARTTAEESAARAAVAEVRIGKLEAAAARREAELDAAAADVAATQRELAEVRAGLAAREGAALATLRAELVEERSAAAALLGTLRACCADAAAAPWVSGPDAAAAPTPGRVADSSGPALVEWLHAVVHAAAQRCESLRAAQGAGALRAAALQAQLDGLRDECERLHGAAHDAERQVAACRSQLAQSQEALAAARGELVGARAETAAGMAEREAATREVADARQAQRDAEAAVAEAGRRLAVAEEAVATKEARLREMRRAMAEALDERRDAAAAAEKERAERREIERQHCTQAAGLVGAMLAGLRPSAGLLTAGDAAAGSTGDRAASAEEDITSGSAEAAFLAGLQQAAEVLARPGAAEDEGLGPMQCLTGTLSLLCDAVSHYASVWRDWVQAQAMLRDIHAKVEAAAAVVSTPALSVPSPGSSPGGPGLRREGAPVTLVRQLRRLASSVLRALELLQAEREGARSALLSSADQRDELLDKIRQLEQSLVTDQPEPGQRPGSNYAQAELEAARDQVLALEQENAELEGRCAGLEGRLREERAKATSDWAGSGCWCWMAD
uniref:Uncharacterized protein n=1 Tax=Auxenochlorella protothecoides TaxID=3075 RepID=A0A1D2A721_AUXPR